MNVPLWVGVPLIVMTFDAQLAVTPAGSPVAVPIPVVPEVVCVILVIVVLTHSVGEEEAAPASHSDSDRYSPNLPPAVRGVAKFTVFSSTVYLSFETPPTRDVRPVLPDGYPLYSLIIPVGALTPPFPDTMILPPEGDPAALLFPALITIAPV